MEWIYGRQVVKLATLPGAARKPRRIVATAAALRSMPVDRSFAPVVEEAPAGRLEQLAGTSEHQGVVAEVPPYPYVAAEELVGRPLVVALDEVTDPRNLGAVARSALAAGADGLVIGRHRAAAVTPAAVKASAGATEHLRIARATNLRAFLQESQGRGAWVYGAAGDAPYSYSATEYADHVVLVLGSEGRGLRRLTAQTCDQLVAVPLHGPVSSLNVSVAAAVVLFEIRRRRERAEKD